MAAAVRAAAPGVPVHTVSCRVPESLDVLRQYLGHGETGALLGSSGVGKSTIVNRLIGHDLLRTHDVRESDSRGRHTSTARQLVLLPGGGVLIDTPGMRELQLWDTGDGMSGSFDDIDALAASCRFRDCRHLQEPGCAVRAAVDAGTLIERPLRELPQAAGGAGAPVPSARSARADRRQAAREGGREGPPEAVEGQGGDWRNRDQDLLIS